MDLKSTNVEDLPRRKFLEKCIKGGLVLTGAPALMGGFASCSRIRPAGPGMGVDPRDLDKRILNRFTYTHIAHLPTPLEYVKDLSSRLNGPRIFMKRDDQTGLAFGGNKTRKLEFIFADAIDKKADVMITWGGLQSNWCRQTVAAAKKFGIRPVLVLSKSDDGPVAFEGNLLLDAIMGADIHLVAPNEDRAEVAEQIAEEERGKGHHPYIVSVGGSRVGYSMTKPLGAVSYTKAFLEIYTEVRQRKLRITHIVHATGSGGTQGGLCAGARAVSSRIAIVGISVGGDKMSGQRDVSAIASETSRALGLHTAVSPEEVIVFDEYVGGGYGILNRETADAIFLVAREEGILLDPVYTGKAMSGLIDLIKKGYFKKDDAVVFIHTGGTPALFPYGKKLLEYLRRGDLSTYKEFYRLA